MIYGVGEWAYHKFIFDERIRLLVDALEEVSASTWNEKRALQYYYPYFNKKLFNIRKRK